MAKGEATWVFQRGLFVTFWSALWDVEIRSHGHQNHDVPQLKNKPGKLPRECSGIELSLESERVLDA